MQKHFFSLLRNNFRFGRMCYLLKNLQIVALRVLNDINSYGYET